MTWSGSGVACCGAKGILNEGPRSYAASQEKGNCYHNFRSHADARGRFLWRELLGKGKWSSFHGVLLVKRRARLKPSSRDTRTLPKH